MRLFWANFKHCAVHFIPFRLHCSDYLGRIIWDESPLGLGRWSEEGKGLPDFELSVEKGGHKNSSTKGWEKGSEDRSCVFPFPFFFHSERWKKASFLARTTTTNHSRWIGVGRAWHQTQTGFLRRHNLLPNYYSNKACTYTVLENDSSLLRLWEW